MSVPPEPPTSPPDDGPDRDTNRLSQRPGVRDALYAVVFMFPAAGLMALVYRFPLPFDDYATGPGGVWDAIVATFFYGLAGGFVLVPGIAAGVGALLRRSSSGDRAVLAVGVPIAAALLYALFLATAEFIFGG